MASRIVPKLLSCTLALALTAFWLAACDSTMQRIDHNVDSLLVETNQDMGGDTLTPRLSDWNLDEAERQFHADYDPTAEFVPTVNPAATDLDFVPSPEDDGTSVIARLEAYNRPQENAIEFDLQAALSFAIANSREYRFEEEEFVLASLRLLIERHQWGPRFFNDMSATVNGSATDGLYDTSLRLVNEFRVTQRLPYGGNVSIRALANATENLHDLVAGEEVQSASVVLSADIPLMRGAGTVARESRVQSERNMVYAARSFERFRREFLQDISEDFLDLVLQLRSLANSEMSLESFIQVENRERARFSEGRIDQFEAARAENATVNARARLNSDRERYRLGVDRFKVRLGMPVDQELVILDSTLGLPMPATDLNNAVRLAMMYRLDLQNQRDGVADSKRRLENARNDLLPDLNLASSVTIPTDPSRDRGGAGIDPDEMDFSAGITFGLPLDREIERLTVRQAQISLERARRSYDQFRDNVATSVRSAVRSIDSARYDLQIQSRSIAIADQRIESIQAAPERANTIEQTDAVNDQLRARDDRDRANRNLQVSILNYLLQTGQLRVSDQGFIQPLLGMELTQGAPKSDAQGTPDPNNTSGG